MLTTSANNSVHRERRGLTQKGSSHGRDRAVGTHVSGVRREALEARPRRMGELINHSNLEETVR